MDRKLNGIEYRLVQHIFLPALCRVWVVVRLGGGGGYFFPENYSSTSTDSLNGVESLTTLPSETKIRFFFNNPFHCFVLLLTGILELLSHLS